MGCKAWRTATMHVSSGGWAFDGQVLDGTGEIADRSAAWGSDMMRRTVR